MEYAQVQCPNKISYIIKAQSPVPCNNTAKIPNRQQFQALYSLHLSQCHSAGAMGRLLRPFRPRAGESPARAGAACQEPPLFIQPRLFRYSCYIRKYKRSPALWALFSPFPPFAAYGQAWANILILYFEA